MPQSRPMPSIGKRCHELRVLDQGHNWRIIHRIDGDAIVIADVFRQEDQGNPGDGRGPLQRPPPSGR